MPPIPNVCKTLNVVGFGGPITTISYPSLDLYSSPAREPLRPLTQCPLLAKSGHEDKKDSGRSFHVLPVDRIPAHRPKHGLEKHTVEPQIALSAELLDADGHALMPVLRLGAVGPE